jgi:hypothetical protein
MRKLTRREALGRTTQAAAAAGLAPALPTALTSPAAAQDAPPLNASAGVDRVTVLTGKTYLRGWAGYGEPPRSNVPRGRGSAAPLPAPAGPSPQVVWTKDSGPGQVVFADPKALITTATFSAPGTYILRLTAGNGQAKAASTLTVLVENPPPAKPLEAVSTNRFKIDSPLWSARVKALVVNWIPHCIDQINRTGIEVGAGGIDNFVEAGKKLRGEPHGCHRGYVFSNAWVYQTIEAMSLALMLDPQGDPGIARAQQKMRATLQDWIPKILSAQEPDGYLQTAFTLPRQGRDRIIDTSGFQHWDPAHRGDHEGYVAGYFLEAAINHYLMTGRKDPRLYHAAKRLADCWCDNLGPPPKKPWYDGHQQMEQGLIRFGRFVNAIEGPGRGQRYIDLGKYLLDARCTTATSPREQQEYDQSHLPVIQQYEAVGHAVRAAYTYSAMADVVLETRDPDYQSAAKSLWDNLVNRKYYVTGGIGSGETSEGFGPNYSLPHRAYNESCSTCGLIFFQWKLNRAYADARYADLYEESLYNALLGAIDLEGRHFYYDNPLEARVPRYRWHVCPCCVGNIPRTLLMLPAWTYAKNPDGVWVNLFVGSSVTIENVAGTDVEMVQRTDYPWSGKVSITVNPKTPKKFTVRIRVPNRAVSALYRPSPQAGGIRAVAVNGSPVKAPIQRGYAVLTRAWKAGDRIDFELPLKPQRIHASDKIEATRGQVALRYGPLIYNLEQEDQDITKSLAPGSPLTAEWRKDFLGGVVVIRGTFSDGTPMLAIPNFARMNRHPGLPYPPAPPPPGPEGRRTLPPPPASIVWIREG